jgi:hypothetical protein
MGFSFTLIFPLLINEIKYSIKGCSTVDSIFYYCGSTAFCGALTAFSVS